MRPPTQARIEAAVFCLCMAYGGRACHKCLGRSVPARVMQELSLLAGNKLQRHASQDLNGMAQFANTVSADSKDDEAGWDASFNTFPMATSMPMPIR